MKGIPGDPCILHTGQMVVFSPHPTRCPEVLNFDISKILHGKLAAGFKNPLPELPLIENDIQNQQNGPPPGGGGLVDPTNQNSIDQAMSAHTEHTPAPMPTIIPSGHHF